MTIALFGTSADPPTAAHGDILQWLSDRYDRVLVWAADNPFKGQQTPLPYRQAMLNLLVRSLNRANVEHHPELSHPYTIHSVEQVKQQWPNEPLTLVVGSDVLAKLPQWYQAEKLLAQVQLLVLQRPGVVIDPKDWQAVQPLCPQVELADYRGPAVSSTTYRQQRDEQQLLPAIAQYIQQQGLYSQP
ncbi:MULTISPECIES: nicotinate-nucleotide adenylyltransferase [unclassified Thermosynechococcus]|uniref:nicotinate-nucleotide adenylyltransferase n=1 Tax=unclassified Thermosynechococcus TaxID=2622553 RepID=UPI002671F73E|nr:MULTISPECIES: nicotinate-nucleotide adenylyltransferase [unclassified Thermosynechococcus]MDR5638598.1 nicotinate-nucleotide adenylyltransferase [Thermosynechococcus sp. PP42]MDR7899131.1 nicotinate-nucleotide adenylyltransferase [Thermosynechococcus sp. JY1332]MDR7906538.1 nicotinate-nucleotide adenylyltransferase [Thermosynechococcus sp. JY1334]MDR7921418.1 nicotinate-nucleotide adenylyltransferase [Thermosynechococcus sp. HY213]MDR7994360.1 nicotinate-nucleotide adenylyltransferase [Ther